MIATSLQHFSDMINNRVRIPKIYSSISRKILAILYSIWITPDNFLIGSIRFSVAENNKKYLLMPDKIFNTKNCQIHQWQTPFGNRAVVPTAHSRWPAISFPPSIHLHLAFRWRSCSADINVSFQARNCLHISHHQVGLETQLAVNAADCTALNVIATIKLLSAPLLCS